MFYFFRMNTVQKAKQAPAKHAPAKQAPAKQQQKQEFPILRSNLAESPVTPPPTSGKKIVQWSTIVKSVPTKPNPIVAPVIVRTPTPTEKERASFRVIPEDDYLSDEVEEEECAAASGSLGYSYGAYSNSTTSSSSAWGDDMDDY